MASPSRSCVPFLISLLLACSFMASAEESEKVTPVGLAIAITWVGAIALAMSLFYCIRNPDPDMRRYTYEVISQTISIFCAVLVFHTCSDVFQHRLIAGKSLEIKVAFNMLQMLVWFLILQGGLGMYSRNLTTRRLTRGSDSDCKTTLSIHLRCTALILSHIVGFASINAWGSLQRLPYFRAEPWQAFASVFVAAVALFLLSSFLDVLRTKLLFVNGNSRLSEEMDLFDQLTMECEVDIMALTLSFTSTQAIRNAVSGVFPDGEGEEPWIAMERHTTFEDFELLSAGFVSLAAMVFFVTWKQKYNAGGGAPPGPLSHFQSSSRFQRLQSNRSQPNCAREESGSSVWYRRTRSDESGTPHPYSTVDEDSDDEEQRVPLVARVVNITIATLACNFAWALYYSAQWSIAGSGLLGTMENKQMQLAAVLTIFISVLSFLSIRLLDCIADLEKTDDPEVAKNLRSIISSLALLIGFTWEQCFDQAIVNISEGLNDLMPGSDLKEISRVVLSVLAVLLVAPAWRHFIVPMVWQGGWKIGFVFEESNLQQLALFMKAEHFAVLQKHCSKHRWFKGQDVSTLATSCHSCGNLFMNDALFCRICGLKRPKIGATEEDIKFYEAELRDRKMSVATRSSVEAGCSSGSALSLPVSVIDSACVRSSVLEAPAEESANACSFQLKVVELQTQHEVDQTRINQLYNELQSVKRDLQVREHADHDRAKDISNFNARMGTMLDTMAMMEAKFRDVSPDRSSFSPPLDKGVCGRQQLTLASAGCLGSPLLAPGSGSEQLDSRDMSSKLPGGVCLPGRQVPSIHAVIKSPQLPLG